MTIDSILEWSKTGKINSLKIDGEEDPLTHSGDEDDDNWEEDLTKMDSEEENVPETPANHNQTVWLYDFKTPTLSKLYL